MKTTKRIAAVVFWLVLAVVAALGGSTLTAALMLESMNDGEDE